MAIENPVTTTGSALIAYRKLYGVPRTHIAARLGKHRNTLAAWDELSEIDAVVWAAYKRAVDELAREKLGKLGSRS